MVLVAVFCAKLLHPACVVRKLVAARELSPSAMWDLDPVEAIEQGAAANALYEPWDPGDWPVITAITELPDHPTCAHCGQPLDE